MKNTILFILFALISCNTPKRFEKEQKILNEIKSKYKIDSNDSSKVFILTGLDGCGACMDYTVKFIEENSNNPDLNFILSGQSHVKIKALFSYPTIHRKNFFRDTLQIALRKELVPKKNPKAFFCKSGTIIDSKDITYQNADSVFHYVNQFLIKK
jgi:hypothetical protein